MTLTPIESNYNFLNLTGKSRGIGAVETYQPYERPIATGGNSFEVGAGRAVDKLPRAQFSDFVEYTAPQAGYQAGISTKTLWA